MTPRQIVMLILAAVWLVAELYILSKRLHFQFPEKWRRVAKYFLLGSIAFPVFCILFLVFIADWSSYPVPRINTFALGLVFTFFFSKFVLSLVLLFRDVLRVLRWFIRKVTQRGVVHIHDPKRRDFLKKLSLAAGGLTFLYYFHGITRGRYHHKVRKVTLSFEDLPTSFDGFRIVQFSDFHAGSFDSREGVEEALQLITDQNPDVILFTGDMVNIWAEELDTYLPLLKTLSAPSGKYAVLGNHDYGHTHKWKTEEEAAANHAALLAKISEAGFTLLQNDSVILEKGGAHIRLAGSENWGNPPFPQKGDLNLTLARQQPGEFTVLMSHDPTFWDVFVLPDSRKVHLTLSGHTHGGQMGVEIPGFRLSPAQIIYKRWAGLYEENGKNLYVNRGFGWLGFPGRAGIYPEVAVFDLHSKV